jgi:hypothetical protein
MLSALVPRSFTLYTNCSGRAAVAAPMTTLYGKLEEAVTRGVIDFDVCVPDSDSDDADTPRAPVSPRLAPREQCRSVPNTYTPPPKDCDGANLQVRQTQTHVDPNNPNNPANPNIDPNLPHIQKP